MKTLKNILFLLCMVLVFTNLLFAQAAMFNRYFTDRTMRVDYFHTGTKGTETVALNQVYEEGEWPGSRINLLDTMNLGEYIFRIFDVGNGAMIYSRGFSSVFNEWQSTDEALSGIYRTFHETVRFPYPNDNIQLTISRRDKQMIFHEVFSTVIDPNSPDQVQHGKHSYDFKVDNIFINGPSEKKVDLLILGDGYAKEDMEKFRADVKHFTDVMFSTSPFKERKNDFNVRAVEAVSEESGIDLPDKGIWKKNILGTRYFTFGSARYILTEENKIMRDIASAVPYEFINILINDNRYGGGGIYNLYNTCFTKTDKKGMEWQMDYVFVHEFGHCFGGLGDEYYTSQVSYNDFYMKGVEPWEPNITTLADTKNFKWKKFVADGTPLPTPWEKARYDSIEKIRGKLDRLAPDYYEKREPFWQAEREMLKDTKYAGKVGAFEGAGYVSQGLYRPSADCRMFSLSLTGFDPVCAAAIDRMIDFCSH